MSVEIVVGLGANIGSREAFLRAALDLLSATSGCELRSVSSVYESEAVGPPQPRYLNAAARLGIDRDPGSLLGRLQEIEEMLGRKRTGRWSARTIDLDILWCGCGALSAPQLTVPHPRLLERAFALAPLLEVQPALEPRYGPGLRALGGAPARIGQLLPRSGTQAGYRESRPGPEIRVRDRADALAAATTALFGQVRQQVGEAHLEVRPLYSKCRSGRECQAFVDAVSEVLASGFAARRAMVSLLASGEVRGGLLGESRAPAESDGPIDARVEERAENGELAINSRSAALRVVAFSAGIPKG